MTCLASPGFTSSGTSKCGPRPASRAQSQRRVGTGSSVLFGSVYTGQSADEPRRAERTRVVRKFDPARFSFFAVWDLGEFERVQNRLWWVDIYSGRVSIDSYSEIQRVSGHRGSTGVDYGAMSHNCL